jgi:hypothetical protein
MSRRQRTRTLSSRIPNGGLREAALRLQLETLAA